MNHGKQKNKYETLRHQALLDLTRNENLTVYFKNGDWYCERRSPAAGHAITHSGIGATRDIAIADCCRTLLDELYGTTKLNGDNNPL